MENIINRFEVVHGRLVKNEIKNDGNLIGVLAVQVGNGKPAEYVKLVITGKERSLAFNDYCNNSGKHAPIYLCGVRGKDTDGNDFLRVTKLLTENNYNNILKEAGIVRNESRQGKGYEIDDEYDYSEDHELLDE